LPPAWASRVRPVSIKSWTMDRLKTVDSTDPEHLCKADWSTSLSVIWFSHSRSSPLVQDELRTKQEGTLEVELVSEEDQWVQFLILGSTHIMLMTRSKSLWGTLLAPLLPQFLKNNPMPNGFPWR
jgi:hypothetical protein